MPRRCGADQACRAPGSADSGHGCRVEQACPEDEASAMGQGRQPAKLATAPMAAASPPVWTDWLPDLGVVSYRFDQAYLWACQLA
jgi:hypothetical protein